MADTRIVEKDEVKYLVEEVKSAKVVVGLAPTRHAQSLDGLLDFVEPETIFKLAYRQMRTDHANKVRAKFNGKGTSAVAVIAAIAAGSITVDEIQNEMAKTNLPFTDAATKLLKTDPDPTAIHWDVL